MSDVSSITASTVPHGWCEPNYAIFSGIAEFTNVISSIPIAVMALIALTSGKWGNYARNVDIDAHITFITVFIVGLSSIYVHATLSDFGLYLDECGISWLILLSYTIQTPSSSRPKLLRHKSVSFMASIAASVIVSLLWPITYPYHGLVNVLLCLPLIIGNVIFMCRNPIPELKFYKWGIIFVNSLCMFGYFGDILLCWWCESTNIPGLHSLFHLGSAAAPHLIFVSVKYRLLREQYPSRQVNIKSYGHPFLCLPYIEIEDDTQSLSTLSI